MSTPKSKTESSMPELKSPMINPLVLACAVVFLALAGTAFVFRFVSMEESKELLAWQNKLSLIADSRASDVNEWINRHFDELSDVAENPSLQLYMSELANITDIKVGEEDPAQMVFLRNLLSITADRLEFTENSSRELSSIGADVKTPSGTGLAILNNDNKVLVSTSGLPVINQDLLDKANQSPRTQPKFIDVFQSANNKSRIGFAIPIFPMDSDPKTAKPLGILVGIKNIGDDLFKRLKHPGATEKTLEAVLLRKKGSAVEYLSPTSSEQGKTPLLLLETPELDSAHAIKSTGEFALKRDTQSAQTLVTSRKIDRTPWVMMQHINRDQALGESDIRIKQLKYSLLFGILAITGCVLAVWHYGASRRNLLLSAETKRMARHLAMQERLLRVVADNQLDPIMIADQKGVVHFANAKASRAFKMETREVIGKDLVALMGVTLAKGYIEANKNSVARGLPYVRTWTNDTGYGINIIRSEHIPLDDLPIDDLPEQSKGVLMIDQDITGIVGEREHRARVFRQLVEMLVHMVDRRDPYAASHSAAVSLVSKAVATNIGLDQTYIETADLAGGLMNIGKILIPSEVLTKTSGLTEGEMRAIRDSVQSSVELLKDIEFDGPVIDTLRQAQERYDGSGPMHMKGDDILITARIIAAANAFVGMVSLRSYRNALSIEQAIANLLANIDTQFDRRIVIALADYIENKKGRETLARTIGKGRV